MRRVATIAAVVVFVALILVVAGSLLAPSSLGGRTALAVIVGSSMRPMLERGDLAIVRQAASYEVGDVVLYHSNTLHRHVMHRIVRRNGDRFMVRGDANSFADPDQPTRSDIIGRYWFAVPRGGSIVDWLQQPLHAAILVFLVSLIALLPAPTRRPRTIE
jgi:signal peptidase I